MGVLMPSWCAMIQTASAMCTRRHLHMELQLRNVCGLLLLDSTPVRYTLVR